ncbi:MAG: hypothetical protein ISS70_08175 [Phycisphaerae bacterium]|nr:hypothetical protein [Phycisphaerae bacterium]
MATEEKEQVGLECLDDETLAAIVDSELREHEKLTYHAETALEELKKRTPQ